MIWLHFNLRDMNINYIDNTEEGKKRAELIKVVLPKETIISTMLEPSIEKALFGVIADCVRMELEVYRAYPKRPAFGNRSKEPVEEVVKTFNPTNNETCFMGKGFKSNNELTDLELTKYRKAIGTIIHPIWGDCTLMEIWGGDHFEDHNEMVVGAFKYGMNLTDSAPEIKVFINPLFQNKKSKTFVLSTKQQEYKDYMEELLAKAVVFGVNTPKEAQRKNKRK